MAVDVARPEAERSALPRLHGLVRVAVAIAAVVAVVLLVPPLLSPQWMGIMVQALLMALPTLGLTLLAGYGGQFSIASGGLLATGAAVTAWLTIQVGLPSLVGVVGATAAGAVVGLIVGLPALRVRGLYLLLATLAAHFILLYLFRRYISGEFGAIGALYEPLTLLGVRFDTPEEWFTLLVPVVALVMAFVANVKRSGVGRSLLAMKQNEVAAAASGINVARLKLAVFIVSSALTAFAGALYALYFQSIAADFFTLHMAINFYVALIVGGQLVAAGAVIGSIFVASGPTLVGNLSRSLDSAWLNEHATELTNLVFGLAIIVVLLIQPKGVWGLVESAARRIRSALADRARPREVQP
jgi:branched-chain amino acid transport system permease protein